METKPPSPPPCITALAAHIPPLECDHREALALLNAIPAREQTDEQAEALVRMYRETRRKDASKRLERDRKRAEGTAKKAEAHARKLERDAKRAEKLSNKAAVRGALCSECDKNPADVRGLCPGCDAYREHTS